MKTPEQKPSSPYTRRKFVKVAGAAGSGMIVMPAYVKGMISNSPSRKLNVAFIGCGGRGLSHVDALKSENYVAFCDVDDVRAAEAYTRFPDVPRFYDYREMLDKMHDQIDGVVVSTPDHTHAVATMAAMQLGKHVYVEKPLTHNIAEARALLDAAKKYKVVTQMGNQGASMDCNRDLSEWIQSGVIGEVFTAHVWTNRPIWPQGVPVPTENVPVPDTLKWDLWQGPAAERPYQPAYLPFKWRGWWDYGTGALGDMGCHLIEPVFRALKLSTPYAIEANTTSVWIGDFVEANYPDSCPPASVVKLDFAPRPDLQPCSVYWYDGGIRPMRPVELKSNEEFGTWDGGILFEGTRGKIMSGKFGENATLLPTDRMRDFTPPPKTLKRIKESHQENWAMACKGEGETTSPFEIAVPLTESLLIGNLAVRCYDLKVLHPGKGPTDWAAYDYLGRVRLDWDTDQMKIVNLKEANQYVSRTYRSGWSLEG